MPVSCIKEISHHSLHNIILFLYVDVQKPVKHCENPIQNNSYAQ